MDVLDARGLPFGNVEGQVHLIARHGRDGGLHFGAIQAAVDVLALDFLLGAVNQRLVIGAACGHACVAQGVLQNLLGELAVAREIDLRHRRALLHDDHQHIALHIQPHVVEQAQRIQGADGRRSGFIRVGVAHAQGQRAKHRARLHTLQAFHADIAHGKRVDGPRHLRCQSGRHQRRESAQTRAMQQGCHARNW